MKKLLILALIGSPFISCSPTEQAPSKPKNVILMIGDGMGFSQVSYATYKAKDLNISRFKHIGISKTSSALQEITDSAAGATALSAGQKTYNNAIGVDLDTLPLPSILLMARDKGLSTGMAVTSSITHATPASFMANVPHRKMEEGIALQSISQNIDYLIGGGINFYSERKDSLNLIDSLKNRGYAVFLNEMPTLNQLEKGKSIVLTNDEGMPRKLDGRDEVLPTATGYLAELLSRNKKGFFLLIEGSQIDWGGHDNDAEYMLTELIDFDLAIGKALDFAEKNKETLIIVTADHETGGLTLTRKDRSYTTLEASFSTPHHTGAAVPVFAFGPGAEEFQGMYENTEIFHKIKKLLNL